MKSKLLPLFASLALASSALAADKKIVFIAGRISHGPAQHEHRAGCLLLKSCLDKVPGITSVVYSNGWPREASAFDSADAVIIYADGGDGHPAIQQDHLKTLDGLMRKGVGMGCIHYAVEIPAGRGGPELLRWIGGYFETNRSVNPTWEADYKSFPDHPIAHGVKPFKIRDEWYYHMRFPENMENVTPILTAIPPDSTRGKPGIDDQHGGNPEVQKHKGEAEHMMWAIQRPDGGRGFGISGAHFHKNWGDDNFRRVVLNAIVWSAKMDVPPDGVQSSVTAEELAANLDDKGPKKPKQ